MEPKGYTTPEQAEEFLTKYCGENRSVIYGRLRACANLYFPEKRLEGETISYKNGHLYFNTMGAQPGFKLERIFILKSTDKGVAFVGDNWTGNRIDVAIMTDDSPETTKELLYEGDIYKDFDEWKREHPETMPGNGVVKTTTTTATTTEKKAYPFIEEVLSSGERFVFMQCAASASGDFLKTFAEVLPLKDPKGFIHLCSAHSERRIDGVAPFNEILVMNIERGKDGERGLCWVEKDDPSLVNYLFAI